MTRHPKLIAYAAFASLCFFWGTTYLAIRMALESLPPLLLVSTRFLISGILMLAAARYWKLELPAGRELWWNALFGLMILGIGNTCLTLSEQLIPSSLAALFIAVSPIWLVGLEAAVPGGEPLRAASLAGIAVSLTGAALLVGPDVFSAGLSGAVVKGFLLLQLGSACWSLGSILQKRRKAPVHAVASAAVHQLAAGLAFLPAALFERQEASWTASGIGALLYLVVFGSIVGYTSYVIALQRLPVAIVSLYTYINPIVAAVLGWLIYREPFGKREMAAMAIIFTGVAIVKRFGHRS